MALNTKEFALKAVRLLNEKKAVDIILLELGKLSLIADYFLICNGTSKIQTKAICDHLLENLPEEEYALLRVEGYNDASWILLDFGALIVHIFNAEERSFYNLERLWGKAKIIDLKYLTPLS
ncbi:MAG TPA: ribosome silencing factor [Firmicutes bacterium]|nr:ribosome silencing factor [Bacillota bacterium]